MFERDELSRYVEECEQRAEESEEKLSQMIIRHGEAERESSALKTEIRDTAS